MVKSNVTAMAKRRTVRVDAEVWARIQEIARRWRAEKEETDKLLQRAAYVQGYLKGLRDASR